MSTRNHTRNCEANGRPVTNPCLIGDLRLGDHQAWVHFYAIYWKWLVGLARGMGVSREDAEDLAQKTLIAVSRKIPQFIYEPARGRFSAWLMVVLKNNVINFWEQGCRDPLRLRVDQDPTDPDPVDNSAGLGNHVITQAMADHFEQVMEESLRELQAQVSEPHWQIFDHVNLKECRAEAIAAQCGLKPGSVYCIVSRMLRQLKTIIDRKLREAGRVDMFAW